MSFCIFNQQRHRADETQNTATSPMLQRWLLYRIKLQDIQNKQLIMTKENKQSLLFFTFLLTTTSLFSQILSDTVARKIDSLFSQWNKYNSPGCAIGVIINDSLVYAKGFGMANLEYAIPTTPATLFNVGSVSKQFTAYCVLLLSEQGKIKLDEDVRVYLPWLPDFDKKITVRNLLNHTSGFRDYLSLAALSGLRRTDGTFTQDLAVNLLKKQRFLNFSPGEEHSYSNSNYILLSEIVKAVSGKSLRVFADSAIFKRLGMTHTHFVDGYAELLTNRAFAYNMIDSSHFANSVRNFYTVGDGNLYTNIEDMAKWIANYYNPRVGNVTNINQFTEKGTLNNGKKIGYALGIFVREYKGWRTFEHGGDFGAYHSFVLVFPAAKTGFIVFGNVGNFDAAGKAHDLANLFIGDKTRNDIIIKKIEDSLAVIKDTLAIMKILGNYISNNGFLVNFRLSSSRLYADIQGDSFLLTKNSTDTFSMIDEPHVKFYFSKNFYKDKSCIVVNPDEAPEVIKQYKGNIVPSDKSLRNYTGEYYSPELDCRYQIVLKNHHLLLTNNKFLDAKLTFAGEDDFITNVWWIPYVKILRNKEKSIQGFELNGPRLRHLLFTKIE